MKIIEEIFLFEKKIEIIVKLFDQIAKEFLEITLEK
jgi:hypothetical protein